MDQPTNPAEYLYPMIMKFWLAPTLALAVQLKLPDLIADGPKSAEELATATSTHLPHLRRMLNALTAENIFTLGEDHRFGPTPLSECLRAGHPSALAHLLNTCAYGENLAAWTELESCVRTGEYAFKVKHGMGWVDYLRGRPDRSEVFAAAMTAVTRANEEAVMRAYEFGQFECAVDIGGNQGTLIGRILQRYPKARGVVFDVPETVETGRVTWQNQPYAARLSAVGGDFFKSVPAGDLYLLKHILHDWSDEDALRILASVRRAMVPGGRILLIEAVLPEQPVPHLGWGLDVTMMAVTGGKERTLAEFDLLFEHAGFRRAGCTPTASLDNVIEARPV